MDSNEPEKMIGVPQNKLFSERSNEPIPDDIRANKKDGEMIIHGLFTWGGFGSALDLVFEY